MEVTHSGPTLDDNTTTIILTPHNAKDFVIVDAIRSGKIRLKEIKVEDSHPEKPEIWIEFEE